jgi:sialate O-acetylesterase
MLQIVPIFSDNMVVQRETPVPVWGTGIEGKTVTVRFGTGKAEAVVRNGKWRCFLPPQHAGVTDSLRASDGDTEIRFKNVIAGDVWLAGGQSNMELELQNSLNGKEELAACANVNIRIYQAVKQAVVDDAFLKAERNNGWNVCGPETAGALSAVAYFFARTVAAETGVPIGIIGCNWGGTSISCWMSEEQLRRSKAGQKCLDDYAARIGDKTDEQWEAEMEAYFAYQRVWESRVQERRKREPAVTWETLKAEYGECPWPQPAGRKSPYCPSNLYHSMVRRIAPFAMKGFLYYQGEEDWDRADDYAELMCYLIGQWRGDWGNRDMPFLFVQLPMYATKEECDAGLENSKQWCIIRENQYKVSRFVANTGMAVIIDRGEFDNIHPLDKQTVGFRLALQALKKAYGRESPADGPVFRKAENEGGAIRVYFANAEIGLESRGELEGFEVAGEDGRYYKADAKIEGGTVCASSDKAAAPVRVRYAWIKWGPTPLYAKNGLAAMPFRSCEDDI